MRYVILAIALCMSIAAVAQTPTRPIILSWVSSTSTTVTGYSLYVCSSTTAVACTPTATGTPAQTFTTTATSGVYQGTIGLYYTMVLVANAPACTGTSPIAVACGNSAPATLSPNPLPVPPQVNGATIATVAVP